MPPSIAPVSLIVNRVRRYVELTKLRILSMVLVTATLGYVFVDGGRGPLALLFLLLTGLGSATGGAAVLNNYLDRPFDVKMVRTRARALPAGLLEPNRALAFGLGLVLAGVLLLAATVNLLSAFLALLGVFLYVLVYTPLKPIIWWNTTFGTIPGAIPPMVGCAAATGHVGAGAWALFAILSAWQHPHFFAIGWIFGDDYRAAGFRTLPVIEPGSEAGARMSSHYTDDGAQKIISSREFIIPLWM